MTEAVARDRLVEDPDRVRAEQTAYYGSEDFTPYFELSKRLAALSPGYARSYEYWLQTVLHALARTPPDLGFLQVGAMDGKRYDPIYAFVQHYRWAGLILEPLPDLFVALSAHYAGHPAVTLVQAALTDSDGTREMVRVQRQAALEGAVPLWAEGLGSFHPERNALGGVGVDGALLAALRQHTRREPVDCLTLSSLVERYGLPRLDLLQVDAEGCELDILRQVDRHGFRPAVVHLEHWALSAADRGALFGLLGERGYLMRMSESDVLAITPALKGEIDGEVGWAC